ncbi:hypothetical protein IW261DRAFT_1428521 [Armillaria novae-zelandiae]|uniref:Uncharacterized protein n=1 Tax=Armillaria novae-zelandiae TaxID=153914 RepID=A0AA39N9H5_9AGAR|nr:hypothetical protein IW261DRAFT_1428521 [Armillaria novae-zelandiae]
MSSVSAGTSKDQLIVIVYALTSLVITLQNISDGSPDDESDTNFTTTLPWENAHLIDWLGVCVFFAGVDITELTNAAQSGRLAAAERRLLKSEWRYKLHRRGSSWSRYEQAVCIRKPRFTSSMLVLKPRSFESWEHRVSTLHSATLEYLGSAEARRTDGWTKVNQSWVNFDDISVSGSLATTPSLRQIAADAAIKGTSLDLPFGDKSLLSLNSFNGAYLYLHRTITIDLSGPPTVVSGTKVGTFVAPAPSAAPSHHSSSRSRALTPPSHVSSAAYRHSSSMAPSTVLPSDSASQVGGSVLGSVKAPSIVPVPAPPIHHSSSHISRSLSRSMSAAPASVPALIPSHVSRNVQSLASSHSSSYSRPLSTLSSGNSSASSGYSVIHAKPNQTVIVPLAHGGCVIVPPKGKRVRVSQRNPLLDW